MKIFFIAILLILGVSSSMAKESKKEDTLIMKSKFNGKETLLYWLPTDKDLGYSYSITRVDLKTKEEKTIKKSVKYLSLKDAKWQLGKEFKQFQMILYPLSLITDPVQRLKSYEQEDNRIGMILFLSTFNQDVAQTVGLMYKDRTAKVNTYYEYKIIAYKDGKKKYEAKTKLHTLQHKLFPIKNLKSHKYSWGVAFTWENYTKYDKYNLYRSDAKDTPFKKINNAPIVVQSEKNRDGTLSTSPYFYTDKNVTKTGKYVYYVKGIDGFGDESARSNMVFGKVMKNKKPMPPVRPITYFDKDKIIIKWNDIVNTNIKGYNLFRGFTYEGVNLKLNKKIIKTHQFVDKNVTINGNYFYAISIINKDGLESKKSLVSMIAPKDTTKPTRPTKLIGKSSVGRVDLKWSASSDANLAGYKVYTSMDPYAKEWKLLNFDKPSVTTSFTHKLSKALSRHSYYYKVRAVDANYNVSKFSNVVKVKLPDVVAPSQPVIKIARAYPKKVSLQWNKITIYDMDYYNIYRQKGKKLIRLNKQPIRELIYVDNNPVDGKNIYVITSVDKSKNESLKVHKFEVLAKDNTPVTVKAFKIKVNKKSVKLSFKVSDKDYKGFEVLRSSGRDKKYYNISGFKKGTTYTDKDLIKNSTYFYKIKAFDKVGNFTQSNVIKSEYQKKGKR
jgi:uncharacterized protein